MPALGRCFYGWRVSYPRHEQATHSYPTKHLPPKPEAVRDTMLELVELLRAEPEAGLRAVLGHFMLVYIHPYMDGNGRMGRFLMNLMLASGGYPWTIVPGRA
ncbi:MAG: Fic family protein, partial [Candidatus Sulfotelmatobacter sp.]